jgi:selenophosphate synthase
LLASPERREAIAENAIRHVRQVHSEASVTAAFHAAIGHPAAMTDVAKPGVVEHVAP